MRVLHLFDYYLPSTLSWVQGLLEGLEGMEVEVGAPWIVGGEFYRPEFRYHEFPVQRWLTGPVLSEWQHPRSRRLLTGSQALFPSYAYWLYHRLKMNPPDVLHAHFGPTGCLYLPLARKLKRPLVVTFYGYDYTMVVRRKPAYLQRYQALFNEAAGVMACSRHGATLLGAMGCPAQKISVVSPGLLPERFPFVPRRKQPGRMRLVQLATFTAKKGHMTTLEAFRLALPACPGLHLTLAGEVVDRRLAQRIHDYVRQHGLQDRVSLPGFIDHSRVAAFLADFDLFIHPSCHTADGDHEDTPVAILEAQATGLPVVATAHMALPEAVRHGATGLLAREGDAQALAAHIRRFYAMDPTEYQAYGLAARAHVESNYNLRSSALRLAALYRHLSS